MPRLLSDIEGKIRHILVTSPQIVDIPRVKLALQAFDRDVAATVVYPEKHLVWEKTHFELLMNELQDGRDISYLSVPNEPWMWPQDLIHVLEEGTLLPSRSLIPNSSKTLLKTQQDIEDIVSSPYWKGKGFDVKPDSTSLYNADGGDLIVFDNTIFVGSYAISDHFYSSRNISFRFNLSPEDYQQAKEEYLRGLRTIDSERGFKAMDADGEPLAHHLTMVFTPIDEKTVVVADIKGTLEYLNTPKNIRPVPRHLKLASQLDKFAEKLKLEYEKVVRMPMVPRLYIPRSDHRGKVPESDDNYSVSQDINHMMNYNNVVQERYNEGGNTIHRVRVPLYTIPERAVDFGMDPSKFKDVQQEAVRIYKSLGVKMQGVQFYDALSRDGGLDCSIKVLRRG